MNLYREYDQKNNFQMNYSREKKIIEFSEKWEGKNLEGRKSKVFWRAFRKGLRNLIITNNYLTLLRKREKLSWLPGKIERIKKEIEKEGNKIEYQT